MSQATRNWFYLALIYRKDTLYHIVGIQINNYSYRGKVHFWHTSDTLNSAIFKFSHAFLICHKLPETDILFGIDIQKRYPLSYSWDSDKQLFIQRKGSFLTYIRHSEQQDNIAVVKSPLKIPCIHNSIIPIAIKGHNLKDTVGYFNSNQHINRGLDPSIHVIDGIYNIKGRSTLQIHVANYTNKYITFNLHRSYRTIHWLYATNFYWNSHHTKDDRWPPLHILPGNVRKSLNQLLETSKLQFAQDETSIGRTHLTNM